MGVSASVLLLFLTIQHEGIKQALHRYLNGRIQDFAVRYRHLLSTPIQIEPVDALASFQSLLTAVQQTPFKLYLFIDEYDNFANEILMSPQMDGDERYERFIHGEGLFKTVFKAIKSASSGQGLDRVFITGISPVVVSDLASDYNSETPLGRGYADLTLIVRPEMRRYQLSDLLFEFKYVGLAAAGLTAEQAQTLSRVEVRGLAPVAAKLAEARERLRQHHQVLQARHGGALQLRSYAVAALGFERVVWEEVAP